MEKISNIKYNINIFLFFLSIITIIILNNDISSIFTSLIFLLFSFFILYIFNCRKKIFYNFFFNIYTIGLFWIAISTFYRLYLNDFLQNTLDPNNFYKYSTISFDNISFIDILSATEGSLAIYIWRPFYNFFNYIGIGKPILIGHLVNNILVGFSGIIGLSICKYIYPNHNNIYNRFTTLFLFCSMFWQFQSIHFRDAFVLFFVTILFYFTIRYLFLNNTKNLISLIFSIIILSFLFTFLRTEFYIIPIVYFILTYFIDTLYNKKNKLKLFFGIFLLFLVVFIYLYFSNNYNTLVNYFYLAKNGYQEEVNNTASSSSLGQSLIINQPAYFRIILGSIYVHIFPIPFWFGFKLDTIYDLFVSLNLFYIIGITPLIYLSYTIYNNTVIKKIKIYILLSYIFIVSAISMTSLETRHISVFYIPLIIQASTVDFTLFKNRYLKILFFLISLLFFVNLLWFIIKIFK